MALTPWRRSTGIGSWFGEPWSNLHREMDRLMGDFFGSGTPATLGEGGLGFTPKVDVKDDKETVRVCAELPGLSIKDVDVAIDDDALTIRGEKRYEKEREAPQGSYTLREIGYGSFERRIPLGTPVIVDKCEASFKNGILEVILPKDLKAGAEKRRTIKVKSHE